NGDEDGCLPYTWNEETCMAPTRSTRAVASPSPTPTATWSPKRSGSCSTSRTIRIPATDCCSTSRSSSVRTRTVGPACVAGSGLFLLFRRRGLRLLRLRFFLGKFQRQDGPDLPAAAL